MLVNDHFDSRVVSPIVASSQGSSGTLVFRFVTYGENTVSVRLQAQAGVGKWLRILAFYTKHRAQKLGIRAQKTFWSYSDEFAYQ